MTAKLCPKNMYSRFIQPKLSAPNVIQILKFLSNEYDIWNKNCLEQVHKVGNNVAIL